MSGNSSENIDKIRDDFGSLHNEFQAFKEHYEQKISINYTLMYL